MDTPSARTIRDAAWHRYKAGLSRARGQGKASRPPGAIPSDREATMRELLSGGVGIVKAAKLAGVGVSAVQRIKAAMTGVTQPAFQTVAA